jgi:hypothetical protein
MRILVASHTYIVDLNCEKFRTLAQLEPGIEVTVVVPKRWQPGGVQNRIVEPKGWQDGSFRVVPVSNFSQNNQGLLTFGWDMVNLLRQFRPQIMQVEQGSKGLGLCRIDYVKSTAGAKSEKSIFHLVESALRAEIPCFSVGSLQPARHRRHCVG